MSKEAMDTLRRWSCDIAYRLEKYYKKNVADKYKISTRVDREVAFDKIFLEYVEQPIPKVIEEFITTEDHFCLIISNHDYNFYIVPVALNFIFYTVGGDKITTKSGWVVLSEKEILDEIVEMLKEY